MLDDRPPLTDAQRSRVEFARLDLARARTTNLAELPAPHLILLVERLRSRLDDALTLIEDITSL